MLRHPTMDKLMELRLTGMAAGLEEQMRMPDIGEISFEERLGLLVDRELTCRDDRRLTLRLKQAKLREQACFEDLDLRAPRGLDKGMILQLGELAWMRERSGVLISSPTGCGKTYLACALGHRAIMRGHTVLYHRTSQLLDDLALGRGDGRRARTLKGLVKVDLLILDDFGMDPLTRENRRDLFDIVEERHGRGSMIIASQLPVEKWHDAIGDPTIADAILDRIVHNAYRITMKGESMRKTRARLTKSGS